MTPPAIVAGACLLTLVEADVRPSGATWREALRVEAIADGGTCSQLTLVIPPGATLTRLTGAAYAPDRKPAKLRAIRQSHPERQPDGSAQIMLYTPDLTAGGRVAVRAKLTHTNGYTFAPGDVRYAALTSRGVALALDAPWQADRRTWWARDATTPVTLAPSTRTAAPPLADVQTERAITITVPPGDPQRRLYPGGGSSSATTVSLAWRSDGAALVPLPPQAKGVRVATEMSVGIDQWPDAIRLTAVADARATVSYTEPDAPTHGEASVPTTVTAAGGRITREGDQFWALAALGYQRVLPDRAQLIRALDQRFRHAVLPEPAIPLTLAPMLAGPPEDAIRALVGWQRERYPVAPLDRDPLFPRRLSTARRDRVATSTEAALALLAVLGQAGIPATWALVRSLDDGPPSALTPAGFRQAVALIRLDGQTRAIDPRCTTCPLFELPDEIAGAPMLSPWGAFTPDPAPASLVMRADARTVRLRGAFAHDFYRARDAGRSVIEAAAEQLAITPAALTKASVSEDGTLLVSLAPDAAFSPFTLPDPDADGRITTTRGERVLTVDAHDVPAPSTGAAGALRWSITPIGTGVAIQLTINAREVRYDDLRAFYAATRPPGHAPVTIGPQSTDDTSPAVPDPNHRDIGDHRNTGDAPHAEAE